ncbi:MAG: serine/threonine protein kinase, partial [Terriglobales bacterium]
ITPVGAPSAHKKLSDGELFSQRYKIGELLGAGGFGVVYQATDMVLQRSVALKVLPAGSDTETMLAFQSEARAISALNNPHIVRVLDFGVTHDGAPYMVMECIEGTSLAALIDAKGKLDVGEASDILFQVCEALQHAHDHGIVHRDLKPSNVLVLKTAGPLEVRVVDFGMARVQRPDQQSFTLTDSGFISGTPLYMSPEQIRHERTDARSDLYSLGCMAFELYSGKAPFPGATTLEIVCRQQQEEPPPLENVPAGVRKIVAQLLEKKPQDRFQSASQVAEAIKPFAPLARSVRIGRKHVVSAALGGTLVAAFAVVTVVVVLVLKVWFCDVEMQEGDRAHKDRRYSEAQEHFKRALNNALWVSQKPEALFDLGQCNFNAGMYSDSTMYF